MSLRSFKLSLRLVVPLALALGLFAYAVTPLVNHLVLNWFIRDTDMHAKLVANTLAQPLSEYVALKQQSKINHLFNNAITDERLYALGFCDTSGQLRYKTTTYPEALGCRGALPDVDEGKPIVHLPQGSLHVTERPIEVDSKYLSKLILLHDMSFIKHRSADTQKYIYGLFTLLAVVNSLIIVLIAQLSWKEWIKATKDLLQGGPDTREKATPPPEVQPLVGDLRAMINELNRERLYRALIMPATEQRERMRSKRTMVKDFNVYCWAGRMLMDVARLSQRERVTTKIHSHSRAPLRRVV